MIRILIVILLVNFQTILFAQQKTFVLNGIIKGEQKFKNAFLFDNNYKQIGKKQIVNSSFTFSGVYYEEQPDEFGEIGVGNLFLSNLDTITTEESLYSGKPFVRCIIMEPQIEVMYLTSLDKFLVKGGKLNEIQNLFYENEYLFKKKLDSAYLKINQKYKNSADNKEKKEVRRSLHYQQKTIDFKLVKNNKDSKIALFNFVDFAINPIVPLEKSWALFNSFPDSIRKSKYGRDVQGLLKDQESQVKSALNISDLMPSFELADVNGKIVKSLNALNKYTLIDFWASWCTPCRAENPNLKLAYKKYHKKGFNIISISIDAEKDKAKWINAITNDKMQEFINLFNPGGSSGIAKDLNINAIPANYLVDRKGKVIAVNLREGGLQKKLARLFSK